MPAAPAASCALCIGKKHTSKRVHRNHPAFPHAMVLTVSFVLSSVTGLVCHRRQRMYGLSAPGRADLPSANLTPASGRQDHTTSPSATTSLVSVLCVAHGFIESALQPFARKMLPRPPHPAPYVRDDRDTPLLWDGMRKVLDVIWGGRKRKYFYKEDWTAQIRLKSHNKSPSMRDSQGAHIAGR
jgi:hypothetical protein